MLPASCDSVPEEKDGLPERKNTLPEPRDTLPGSKDTLPDLENSLPGQMPNLPSSLIRPLERFNSSAFFIVLRISVILNTNCHVKNPGCGSCVDSGGSIVTGNGCGRRPGPGLDAYGRVIARRIPGDNAGVCGRVLFIPVNDFPF
jgi:hypothetical protein